MAIVPIDERGRLTIHKEFGVRDIRAVIIPAGSFIVAIPPPQGTPQGGRGLARHRQDQGRVRALAEEEAKKSAARRAERRRRA